MKHNRLAVVVIILLLASLSCGLFGGGDSGAVGSGAEPPSGNEGAPAGNGGISSEYPLPSEHSNLIELGEGAINFQTPMKLTDVVAFYRDEFSNKGYQERDILTVIDDTTFSIVWDGHASGKALVVQGVDLGNGNVNVNIRLEDV